MNPAIEAAWIAAGSGLGGVLIGVGGTVVVAVVGFRSTRSTTGTTVAANSADIRVQIAAATVDLKAQIEADRRNRVWERQADAYTDAIAGIRHQQKVRHAQWQQVLTGGKRETPESPVDWSTLEARMIVYSSPAVIDALKAASDAGCRYLDALAIWHAEGEQLRELAGAGAPIPPRPAGQRPAREVAEEALAEANRLDDALMDTIRAELHATADKPPSPPVPLAPPRESREIPRSI